MLIYGREGKVPGKTVHGMAPTVVCSNPLMVERRGRSLPTAYQPPNRGLEELVLQLRLLMVVEFMPRWNHPSLGECTGVMTQVNIGQSLPMTTDTSGGQVILRK